jgi:hypothetical protein
MLNFLTNYRTHSTLSLDFFAHLLQVGSSSVDKYGRKVKDKKKARKAALAEFSELYDLDLQASGASDGGKGGEQGGEKGDGKRKEKRGVAGEKGSMETAKEGSKKSKQTATSRLDYLTKLSRGEISGSSSESDSDSDSGTGSSDEESDSSADDDAKPSLYQQQEEQEAPTGDETRRFALQNCYWDRIKATDIMAVLQACVSRITCPLAVKRPFCVFTALWHSHPPPLCLPLKAHNPRTFRFVAIIYTVLLPSWPHRPVRGCIPF